MAASPAEIRNIFRRRGFSKNRTANANDCAGIKGSVDLRPRIVPHKQTAFRSGRDSLSGCRMPYFNLPGVVLEIGRGCTGSEITPFTDHRISEIALMPFV